MAKRAIPAAADPTAVRRTLGYLSDVEVAAVLGVQPLTLRNRISQGKAPPSFKVGNDHLFDQKELQAWIRRRRFTGGQT